MNPFISKWIPVIVLKYKNKESLIVKNISNEKYIINLNSSKNSWLSKYSFTKGDIFFVELIEKDLIIRQVPEANGAIVVMDPHTGDVLALSGGYSFKISEFNRATQAKRQPGSAFKPFVYIAALKEGFTP